MNVLYVSVNFILHSNFHTDELVSHLANTMLPEFEINCVIDGPKLFHNNVLLTKPFITGIQIFIDHKPVTMFFEDKEKEVQSKLQTFFDALMNLPEPEASNVTAAVV